MYRVYIKMIFFKFEKDLFGEYWNDKYVEKNYVDDSLIISNEDNNMLKIINKVAELTEQIINDKGESVRVEYVNIVKI